MNLKYALFGVVVLFLVVPVSAQSEYTLTASAEISSEGYLTFSWETLIEDDVELLLTRTDDAQFLKRVPVTGKEMVHYSGMDNGDYSAQLTHVNGAVLSNAVTFTVAHRSLKQAFTLFGLGAALFVGLLLFFLLGTKTTPAQQMGGGDA